MIRTRWPRISLARKGVGSSLCRAISERLSWRAGPFASSNECSVKVRLLPSVTQGCADSADGHKRTIGPWAPEPPMS
jgi:hypothetical protein